MENGISIWQLVFMLISIAPFVFVLLSKKIIGQKKIVWLVVSFLFFLLLNIPF